MTHESSESHQSFEQGRLITGVISSIDSSIHYLVEGVDHRVEFEGDAEGLAQPPHPEEVLDVLQGGNSIG